MRCSKPLAAPSAVRSGSYGALDLNADVSDARWTIRAFVKNATDERAYPFIAQIPDFSGAVDHLVGVPIQPRTVGVEFDYKF